MEEITHHQKDRWNPINDGINHLSTGDFFHPPYQLCLYHVPCLWSLWKIHLSRWLTMTIKLAPTRREPLCGCDNQKYRYIYIYINIYIYIYIYMYKCHRDVELLDDRYTRWRNKNIYIVPEISSRRNESRWPNRVMCFLIGPSAVLPMRSGVRPQLAWRDQLWMERQSTKMVIWSTGMSV